MTPLTNSEILKAQLLASGWHEEYAQQAINVLNEECNPETVALLAGEYRTQLLELFNTYTLSEKLNRIINGAISKKDYRAAAIATATLVKLRASVKPECFL